jgi:hypothetical protein
VTRRPICRLLGGGCINLGWREEHHGSHPGATSGAHSSDVRVTTSSDLERANGAAPYWGLAPLGVIFWRTTRT